MSNTVYPVLVLEKDDGSVYECYSYRDLLGRIERIDIENAVYTAWDRERCLLKLAVQSGRDWLQVELTSQRLDPDHFELLKSRAVLERRL